MTTSRRLKAIPLTRQPQSLQVISEFSSPRYVYKYARINV
jgi:hypothetical protein